MGGGGGFWVRDGMRWNSLSGRGLSAKFRVSRNGSKTPFSKYESPALTADLWARSEAGPTSPARRVEASSFAEAVAPTAHRRVRHFDEEADEYWRSLDRGSARSVGEASGGRIAKAGANAWVWMVCWQTRGKGGELGAILQPSKATP